MGKKIVLLGGNRLHQGFGLKKTEYGVDEIFVIDWNQIPDFTGDRHIQCDIKDAKQICQSGIPWEEVICVYTSADIAVSSQITLHKKMNLLTPDYEAVQNTLIKGNSSMCWKQAGILNKYSQVFSSADDFPKYPSMDYIIKPNISSGSRNITILKQDEFTEEKLTHAFRIASDVSYDNKVIVEEYCEGTEFTVEMLGDNYGNVGVYGISKKYHTPYNHTNKIATKLHYTPLDLSNTELQELAAFGQDCYRALGLKNSFGHLEVIKKWNGDLVPVEMGARSSGFIASHLVDLVSKTCYLLDYCKVLRGEKITDGINFDFNKSSMYYFYDICPGISYSTHSLMEFLPEQIQSYCHDRNLLVAGKTFTPIIADHERYGFEILGGDRDLLTIDTINHAEKRFLKSFIR